MSERPESERFAMTPEQSEGKKDATADEKTDAGSAADRVSVEGPVESVLSNPSRLTIAGVLIPIHGGTQCRDRGGQSMECSDFFVQVAVGDAVQATDNVGPFETFDAETGQLDSSREMPEDTRLSGVCTSSPMPPRDGDDDGVPDDSEVALGTDPEAPDTDGDGLLDGWESRFGTDPLVAGDQILDPDGDDDLLSPW